MSLTIQWNLNLQFRKPLIMHLILHIHLTELSTELKSSMCLRPQVSRDQIVHANMNLRQLFIIGRYFHVHPFSSVNWKILKFLLLPGPSFFPASFMCNCTHPLITLWHIFSDSLPLLLAPGPQWPLHLRRPPPTLPQAEHQPGTLQLLWAPPRLYSPGGFKEPWSLQRQDFQAGFPGQMSWIMNRMMNGVPGRKYLDNYEVKYNLMANCIFQLFLF